MKKALNYKIEVSWHCRTDKVVSWVHTAVSPNQKVQRRSCHLDTRPCHLTKRFTDGRVTYTHGRCRLRSLHLALSYSTEKFMFIPSQNNLSKITYNHLSFKITYTSFSLKNPSSSQNLSQPKLITKNRIFNLSNSPNTKESFNNQLFKMFIFVLPTKKINTTSQFKPQLHQWEYPWHNSTSYNNNNII